LISVYGFIRALRITNLCGGTKAFDLFYTADSEEFKGIVSEKLKEVFGVDTRDAGAMAPYEGAYDIRRKQYDSHVLLDYLLRVMRSENALWVLDQDIFYDNMNFVMGLAMFHMGAVVSTYRLDSAEMVAKESIHEVGHVLGLQHCRNECVMQFSNSIEAAQKKPSVPCAHCKGLLNRKIIETRPPS
jgi:archaemetzincin